MDRSPAFVTEPLIIGPPQVVRRKRRRAQPLVQVMQRVAPVYSFVATQTRRTAAQADERLIP